MQAHSLLLSPQYHEHQMFGVYLPRADIKIKSLIIHHAAKRMGKRTYILGPDVLNLDSK
jgi:hypothetical protein